MTKYKGLEKARVEFNKWHGHACIMIDTADQTAWCEVFPSSLEWTEYHSPTIKKVAKKVRIHDQSNKLKREELKELLNNL